MLSAQLITLNYLIDMFENEKIMTGLSSLVN